MFFQTDNISSTAELLTQPCWGLSGDVSMQRRSAHDAYLHEEQHRAGFIEGSPISVDVGPQGDDKLDHTLLHAVIDGTLDGDRHGCCRGRSSHTHCKHWPERPAKPLPEVDDYTL